MRKKKVPESGATSTSPRVQPQLAAQLRSFGFGALRGLVSRVQARLEGLAQDYDARAVQSGNLWPKVIAAEQLDAWERRVIHELARVLHDQARAEVLVLDAGFPAEMLPSFITPHVFWSRVVRDARNGALHGGLGPILERASKLYPANAVFTQATRSKPAG